LKNFVVSKEVDFECDIMTLEVNAQLVIVVDRVLSVAAEELVLVVKKYDALGG
jgi:hypothetical protein